jgi:hypothetical protein
MYVAPLSRRRRSVGPPSILALRNMPMTGNWGLYSVFNLSE